MNYNERKAEIETAYHAAVGSAQVTYQRELDAAERESEPDSEANQVRVGAAHTAYSETVERAETIRREQLDQLEQAAPRGVLMALAVRDWQAELAGLMPRVAVAEQTVAEAERGHRATTEAYYLARDTAHGLPEKEARSAEAGVIKAQQAMTSSRDTLRDANREVRRLYQVRDGLRSKIRLAGKTNPGLVLVESPTETNPLSKAAGLAGQLARAGRRLAQGAVQR